MSFAESVHICGICGCLVRIRMSDWLIAFCWPGQGPRRGLDELVWRQTRQQARSERWFTGLYSIIYWPNFCRKFFDRRAGTNWASRSACIAFFRPLLAALQERIVLTPF